MRHLPLRILVALATLTACGVRNLGGDELGDSSTGLTSTGPAPGATDPVPTTTDVDATSDAPVATDSASGSASASTGVPPDSTGLDSAESSGCGFICEGDLPPNSDDCPGTHQLDPECPAGHKCTVEGSFGNTQCVPIDPEPKGLYEPCKLEGDWLSGLDDCGLGMMCWDADERGNGICVGFCDGEADSDCVCADPQAVAQWCQECAVGLCLPACDPIFQDCNNDDLCIPSNDHFICVIDASGDEGQLNDPCEFANACDKGLFCVETSVASAACDPQVSGCCQPFCELPGGTCPNPDQECIAWYEDPPAGSEHIGICAIPK
jgi:hypothetical protein